MRFKQSGGYIEVIEAKDGKSVKIVLLPEGRKFIKEQRDDKLSKEAGENIWNKGTAFIFEDLFEHIRCNSALEFIRPEEIAALTDAPIFGVDVDRDDHGKLVSTGNVYWHERYAVECPLETLLKERKIVLPGAPENTKP